MNLTKRLIALAVVAVMLASSCIFASAAMLTYQSGHNITSDGAVKYTKYSAAGAHTETATVLQFNPKDGYIPVAFDSAPTSVASIPNQYSTAVNTYGYEVAGMINAGYFTMSTSTLEGMVITDGKIVATTSGAYNVVAFGSDGSMDIVTTQPKYTVGINGKTFDNPIYFFNKQYADAGSTYRSAYMFYYDYSANASTSYSESGIEVLFEKMDNSELSYGETLVGKVVSKKTSTTGSTTIAKNQFVLFAKTGSTYASELSALAVGDKVTINVTETNAGAVAVMNKANSVLNNIEYLVKDGENYTYTVTNPGGHSATSTYARWTAYGVKADGTYVFFTSEGGSTGNSSRSLTLRNVADALIELGCVTAVRLDGGGSTGMYVSNTGSGSAGWVMTGQRSVADTILVVKKSSMHDATLESQLKSAIASAKQTAGSNASVLKAIAEAEALIGTNATEGQLRKAITTLSPKAMLGQALAKCEVLNIGQYTEPDLANLRAIYDTAKAIYNSDSATDAQYSEQTSKVYAALEKSTTVILSAGASYTTTAPNRGTGDIHNDDQYRLTDGTKGGLDLSQTSYAGWGTAALSDKTVNIDVDLGAVQSSNTFTVYMASGMWGISTPAVTLNVYTSTDGVNYNTLVGTTTARKAVASATVGSETCYTHTYTVTSSSDVSARYVRFSIKNTANFTWLDEVEVSRCRESQYEVVSNYTKIQNFNTKITAGSSTIFTPDMGALSQDNANHTWSSNVICELQTDGSYIVVENVSWHGDSSKVITLKSNQIMICAHGDASVDGSSANAAALGAAQVGQQLYAYGIDLANKTISVAAYVKFGTPHTHAAQGDWQYNANNHWKDCACGEDMNVGAHVAGDWVVVEEATTEKAGLQKKYCTTCGYEMASETIPQLHTHAAQGDWKYNASKHWKDCSCGEDMNVGTHVAGDWVVVEEATTEKAGLQKKYCTTCGYEMASEVIPQIHVHAAQGVWKYNDSIHWKDCACGEDMNVGTHVSGDWIVINAATTEKTGLKKKYCTTCGYEMASEVIPQLPDTEPDPDLVIGDLNGNGEVDAFDYALQKRLYFGTFAVENGDIADLNGNDQVDAFDYVLLKRVYFGTYTIG